MYVLYLMFKMFLIVIIRRTVIKICEFFCANPVSLEVHFTMIYRNNVFIYLILYLCYTVILFSGDMADVDRPITQVAIVADSTRCPPGFTLVILFDFQKNVLFWNRGYSVHRISRIVEEPRVYSLKDYPWTDSHTIHWNVSSVTDWKMSSFVDGMFRICQRKFFTVL